MCAGHRWLPHVALSMLIMPFACFWAAGQFLASQAEDRVDGLQDLRPLGNDQIAHHIVHPKVNKKLPACFFFVFFFACSTAAMGTASSKPHLPLATKHFALEQLLKP